MILHFVVPGEPIPKARVRARVVTSRAGKSFAHLYTPDQTSAFEDRVRLMCQSAVAGARWTWTPKDRFRMAIRVYRTHEGRGGDVDNYAKSVADAINGVAFADDRYVREMRVRLEQDAARPRVEVQVQRFGPSLVYTRPRSLKGVSP